MEENKNAIAIAILYLRIEREWTNNNHQLICIECTHHHLHAFIHCGDMVSGFDGDYFTKPIL